jgi:predicted 3-demethylubiquinone-9 3-methyltransferase (glyoxalase superfamily)
MQVVTPCLWFDHQAEEAAKFYTSIFINSKIGAIARYGDTGPGPKGSVMTVLFTLEGQQFMGLNGGPVYKFTPAISLMVNCDTQKEIDRLWAKLSEGGQEVECGWITDKYGLSWQIVPKAIQKMLTDRDPAKTQSMMAALLKMKKLDIAALKRAYEKG